MRKTSTLIILFLLILLVVIATNNDNAGNDAVLPDQGVFASEVFPFSIKEVSGITYHDQTARPSVVLRQGSGEVGSIHVINRENSNYFDDYLNILATPTVCPDSAGSIDMSSDTQYEEYVYCAVLDGAYEIPDGWMELVECQGSYWHGNLGDPLECRHEYWHLNDSSDHLYRLHIELPSEPTENEKGVLLRLLGSFEDRNER